MVRKSLFIGMVLLVVSALSGCSASPAAIETAIAETQAVLPTATPTSTETPTAIPTATATPTLVPTPASTQASYRIAFEAPYETWGDVFSMDQDGGNLQKLTQDSDKASDKAWNAVWSPDGLRIAHLTRLVGWRSHIEGFVTVMDADGGNWEFISPRSAIVSEIVWSPDGSELAFVSYNGSAYSLFVYTFSDAELTLLLDSYPSIEGIAWSPEGTRIAFAESEGGPGGVFQGTKPVSLQIVDVNSGAITSIADEDLPASYPPIWSPDGTSLVYLGDWDEASEEGVLYLVDAATLIARSLGVPASEAPYHAYLAWSPDSTRIVYPWKRDLYTTDIGGTTTQLTDIEQDELLGYVTHAKWSPDGSMIAFLGDVNAGVGLELFIVLPDGTELLRLALDLMVTRWEWSQDGALIVAESNGVIADCSNCAGPNTEDPGIYLINVIQQTFTYIAEDGLAPSFQPHP